MQLWKHFLAVDVDGSQAGQDTTRALTRRDVLRAGSTAAAAAALAGIPTAPAAAARPGAGRSRRGTTQAFTDEPVTLASARQRWAELGAVGDERGTAALVTSEKTTRALRSLGGPRQKVYNLGEPMYPGVPAFSSIPPRKFDLYITQYGPFGVNELVYLEERFASMTFQIGTQVDELNHIGIDGVYYGGFAEADIVPLHGIEDPLARQQKAEEDSDSNNYGAGSILGGTRRLGIQHMGPIVTRGVLLDVLGQKRAVGDTDALSADGQTLAPAYRITIADLEAAMDFGGIRRIEPGDLVLLRTGWSKLWEDPSRWNDYLSTEPGIWMAEARWLAQFRPLMVASDTWGVEVVPSPVPTRLFEAHQLLLTQEGIRLGEAFVSDGLAADGVFEFVFIDTPHYALGATAANNAPAAIGTPSPSRRPTRSRS